ncbi:MerR family transcriptional regulator [Amycolatopsis sp. NPDC004368]
MFSIGEFAKLGRVSVRMLRHYDALGLLRPAKVDPHSGYRSYAAGQLARLNRILALTDLGFGLKQVADLLDDEPGAEQLRGMLRLRHAELATQVAEAAGRLARVEARLRLIESEEDVMDVVVKPVSGAKVVAVSGIAESFEYHEIGPVVGGLCASLAERMERAGLKFAGPAVAWYEPAADDRIQVRACAPYVGSPSGEGLCETDLPAIEQAATLVHRGTMDTIAGSYQALARWIDDNGYRAEPVKAREVYLHTEGDEKEWITELQIPIASTRG